MGERYLVTGTQLGVLISLNDKDERKKIVDDIIDKQFIATSGQPVDADVHNVIKLLRLGIKTMSISDVAKVSLCPHCHSMTHTLFDGLCGKCHEKKG